MAEHVKMTSQAWLRGGRGVWRADCANLASGDAQGGGGVVGVNPLETGPPAFLPLLSHLLPSISLSLISGWL
jgi:hypothetical protein